MIIRPSDVPFLITLSNRYFAFSAPVLLLCLFMWAVSDGTFDTFYGMWQRIGVRLFTPRDSQDIREPKKRLSQRIGRWYIKGIWLGVAWLLIAIICWLLGK
ncbi:MAG: DUF3899 domain-containing protein [Aerococcus sp.]|nr:DUF3899 domain-containing protein [Aerococcus sp.]